MNEIELDSPALVMHRLSQIEHDLAELENDYASAAEEWYLAKREIEKIKAEAMLSSESKFVAEKRAAAEIAGWDMDGGSEARYVAIKARVSVLESRSMILMALLKTQGRF